MDVEKTRRESPAAKQRREVAEALVALVKDALANGETPPWRKPWVAGLGSHRNGRKGSTDKYKRWNAWSVWTVAVRRGFRSERWYTANQGACLGWLLKPGAMPASIITPMMGGSTLGEDDGGGGFVGRWGHAEIYNREQFVGPPPEPPPSPWDDVRGVARVISLYRSVGLDLQTAGYAYFNHGGLDALDHVGLPAAHQFESAESWAATALHELIHWAGHATRLARISHPWSYEAYAMEELVAELGAAMLGAELRLAATRVDDDQHHAYLTIWASRIQSDPEALPKALAQADAAVDFLKEIAPDAFKAMPDEVASAAVRDVPRTIRDGDVWRGEAKVRLASPRPLSALPALVVGPETARAVAGWCEAAARWAESDGSVPPVLLVSGAPGDGAETLVDWLHAFLRGDAEAASVQVRGAGGASPWTLERGHRWEGVPLRRAAPNRLPAWAFLPPGAPSRLLREVIELPANGRDVVEALARARRSLPFVVVGRYVRVAADARHQDIFVADLAAEPLAVEAARWRLRKTDPRLWIAAGHRRVSVTRSIESWSARLRGSAPWLDGRIHGTKDTLRRLPFRDAAPFSPVVLQTAQAVLDALAREGAPSIGLPELMERALRDNAVSTGASLIPLDALVGPSFGRRSVAAPHDGEAPAPTVRLYDRARFVVQLLQLCPELSRGSKGIALLLQTSMDHDLDAVAREIDATCGKKLAHNMRDGRLEKSSHSWSCDRPLPVDAGRAGGRIPVSWDEQTP